MLNYIKETGHLSASKELQRDYDPSNLIKAADAFRNSYGSEKRDTMEPRNRK